MNLPQLMLNLLFSDIAGALVERNPPNPLFLYHWSTIVTYQSKTDSQELEMF